MLFLVHVIPSVFLSVLTRGDEGAAERGTGNEKERENHNVLLDVRFLNNTFLGSAGGFVSKANGRSRLLKPFLLLRYFCMANNVHRRTFSKLASASVSSSTESVSRMRSNNSSPVRGKVFMTSSASFFFSRRAFCISRNYSKGERNTTGDITSQEATGKRNIMEDIASGQLEELRGNATLRWTLETTE